MVRIPLEVRFFQNLNGASLHRAFHVHPSIVPIWLKYCWKGRKTPTQTSFRNDKKISDTSKKCDLPKIWTNVVLPKNYVSKRYRLNGKQYRSWSDCSSSLIWVNTVCLDLSVRKLWIITKYFVTSLYGIGHWEIPLKNIRNFKRCELGIENSVIHYGNLFDITRLAGWCLAVIVSHRILLDWTTIFEPPHDKTNKMDVRPSKTQISLGIHKQDIMPFRLYSICEWFCPEFTPL